MCMYFQYNCCSTYAVCNNCTCIDVYICLSYIILMIIWPQVVFLPHKKKKNFCWDMATLMHWKQVYIYMVYTYVNNQVCMCIYVVDILLVCM